MNKNMKLLLGVLGGTLVIMLLLANVFGGSMHGMGMMMDGGMMGGAMFGMLFMMLFWVLVLTLLVLLVVWVVNQTQRR